MALPVSKFHDLVFNRGTVARTDTFDGPRIHGRATEVLANHSMRSRSCPRNPAFDLWIGNSVRHQRKGHGLLVSGLHLEAAPVDRASIKSRRRAGFQTPEPEPRTYHGFRQ